MKGRYSSNSCSNPCIDGYYDKKNKINVICITRGRNDPPIDRSHCKPIDVRLDWSKPGYNGTGHESQPGKIHTKKPSNFDKQFYEPIPYIAPKFPLSIPNPKYLNPPTKPSLEISEKQTFVGRVLSEASKYGFNTPQYQSQVNQMSADDLSKQYQNWKALEKQIIVGKVLSEADKYGLNNSVYQQQVNTMSDCELSKQYQEWKALEKRVLVGKVLTQYSEATGKSIDEIDEKTKSDLNNADQAILEKIYNDNIQNKQAVLVGTILSQVNEISAKPLNELDRETIDFVNNSELATLQLIYNTNVNQKQLLENGTVGLYELYFRLPVNVSYKALYDSSYFNSDINKLLTRQLDLKKISNLNLTNNQIADDGAKVIADSLTKGEMPNLKKLHLEGNKITDKGDNFIINAIKNIKQHIIVLTRDLKEDGKMIFGSKEEKIIEYKKILAKCSEQGINNQVIVVNKTSFDKAKNLGQVGTSIVVGFSKCHWELETLTQWYAQDKILAKLPKIGKVLVNTFNADDILSCYVESKKEAFTSPIGCQIIKDELCVMGETEFCE